MKGYTPRAGMATRLRIDPGEYKVRGIQAHEQWYGGEVTSVKIDFEILSGLPAGLTISTWYNLKHESLSPDTRYYREWTLANDGIEPQQNQEIPFDVFIDKTFLAEIGDNQPRPNEKKSKKVYSKVKRLIELIDDGS